MEDRVQPFDQYVTSYEDLDKVFKFIRLLNEFDKIDGEMESDSDDQLLDITINYLASIDAKTIPSDSSSSNKPELSDSEDTESESTKKCPITYSMRDTTNPMESLSELEFEVKYRFNKETVQDILEMIRYGLTKYTNRGQPFPPIVQLLITLRFLATGSFQSKTDNQASQPTISRIIKKITTLLSELKLRFIKIPERNVFKRISARFLTSGSFPDAFGCVGSTHIPVKSPGKAIAEGYLNEKGFYSFRTLIICGPDLEFFEIISRWPGATNENKIFNISEIHQRFEYNQMDGVLLADRNYANRIFVLTPIDTPRNVKEWRYNEAHKQTYNIPEAVELWKKRFNCLQTVLNNKEDTTQSIITACAVLHNIAIQRKQVLHCLEKNTKRKNVEAKESGSGTLKRKCFSVDFGIIQEPMGLLERDHFIQKHF